MNSSRKRRWPLALLALLVTMAVLAIVAGSAVALHKTSDTTFCVSCHSMQRPLAEYQGSVHFQNHAGIRADCADCHIPTQPAAYMMTKLAASKDLLGELTSKLATEERYNAHKLAMAESVWRKMKAEDSATCRSCHSYAAMDILEQRPEARKAHPVAIKSGETCIDCHRGVAHILPDMRASNASGAAQLTALAAADKTDTRPLYAISTQPFTLSSDDNLAAGTLFPAAELFPLRHENGRTEAELRGWQQEGVTGAIYAAKGKRVISAIIAPEAAPQIKILATEQESQTDTRWHRVSLRLQVASDTLIADRQQLWQYAASLMTANCTGCHGLTAPDRYTANQWTSVIKGMASRTSLDTEQLRLLTRYVQEYASDMKPAEQGEHHEE